MKGDHLEPIVWADIETWLRNPRALLEELRGETRGDEAEAVREASRMTLQAALDGLDDRRTRRLAQHERGHLSDSELDAALKEIEAEREEVVSRLSVLDPSPEPEAPMPVDLIREIQARLDEGLSDQERQQIVRHLVSRITIWTDILADGTKSARAVVEYRFPAHPGCENGEHPCGSEDCCSHFLHGCPCGYYGDSVRTCSCPEAAVSRYQRRVSGPLLDRLDLFVDVPRVEYQELTGATTGERSEAVRARVIDAREHQAQRLRATPYLTNAEMGPLEVRTHCQDLLSPEAQPIIATAVQQLGLSARAYHRVLKVARTVADLAGSDRIEAQHLAEAIQYRRRGVD